MKKIELLSPAGNMKCLKAAVLARADAVYIGGRHFSARASAGNFTNEEIKEAIVYCHLRNVRLYVAINILIYEMEIKPLLEFVSYLISVFVDAIIVQDIGVCNLLHNKFPDLELHSSTQMHIYDENGINEVKALGVKRVVIARETSLTDIKNIIKHTNMNIEVFAHGALCFAYSGQCQMSYLIGKRSGNRGLCAGTCRQAFKKLKNNVNISNENFPLSTKELSAIALIPSFIKSGITSLKIEGRLKSPEYVYYVTHYYREAINAYYNNEIYNTSKAIHDLSIIYNREFTDGYINHEPNIVNGNTSNHQGKIIGEVVKQIPNYIFLKLNETLNRLDGIRVGNDYGFTVSKIFINNTDVEQGNKNDIVKIPCQEFIKIGSIVRKTASIEHVNYLKDIMNSFDKKINIDVEVFAKILSPIKIKFTCGEFSVIKEGNSVVSKALNTPVSKEKIVKQLSKLGTTVYKLNNINIVGDNNIFFPISELNLLRREIVDELNNLRLKRKTVKMKNFKINTNNSYDKKITINVIVKKDYQYELLKDTNYILFTTNIDLSNKHNILYWQPNINNHLKRDTVSDLSSLYNHKSKLSTSHLNVVNSYSVNYLLTKGIETITLSNELTTSQIKHIISNYEYKVNTNVEIYKREVAMVTKHKLDCDKLTDKYGNTYPVEKLDNTFKILDYKITNRLYEIDELIANGVNNFTCFFTDETEEEMNKILNKVRDKCD